MDLARDQPPTPALYHISTATHEAKLGSEGWQNVAAGASELDCALITLTRACHERQNGAWRRENDETLASCWGRIGPNGANHPLLS